MKKSIKQKIESVKTYQGQKKILTQWAADWHNSQDGFFYQLKAAVHNGDYGQARRIISIMENAGDKRFIALNNIIDVVSTPGRQLHNSERRNTTEENTDNEYIPEIEIQRNTLHDRIPVPEVEGLLRRYKSGMSIKELSDYYSMSHGKIVKILVTAGAYTNDTYNRICKLREKGKSDAEIMDLLKIDKSALFSYTPYKKGVYNLSDPTENAKRIRKMRENRK